MLSLLTCMPIISTLVELFVEGVEKGDYEPNLSLVQEEQQAQVPQVVSVLQDHRQCCPAPLHGLVTLSHLPFHLQLSPYKRG